jgi:hypothetical protein
VTPLERLLAEELPTGTFGGPRPDARRRDEPLPPVTRADADRNWAALAAAIGEAPLRPVPDQEAA